MNPITEFFLQGGPLMYAVAGGCSCSALGAVAGGIAFGWKRWVGMLVFVLLSSVPFFTGVAGTVMGLMQTRAAVAGASSELVDELLAQGNALSMYPTYLAAGEICFCLGVFVVLAMISGAFFRRRRFNRLMEE